jgi:hypothetical protein
MGIEPIGYFVASVAFLGVSIKLFENAIEVKAHENAQDTDNFLHVWRGES